MAVVKFSRQFDQGLDTEVSVMNDSTRTFDASVNGVGFDDPELADSPVSSPAIAKPIESKAPGGAPLVNERTTPLYQGTLLTANGPISDVMAAERFRILRAKIERHNLGEKRVHILAMTSAVPEEGKSFCAVNLARAFGADPTGRTLLIDCDLRRPTVNHYFGLGPVAGISDVLVGGKSLGSVIRPQANGVDIITSGTPVNDPAAVLEQPIFARYLYELKKHYKYVILDCPPALVCPEPITISTVCEATLLVVRAWRTDRKVVGDAVRVIGKERILATILNEGTDPAESYSYYRYYGYMQSRIKQANRKSSF